MRRPAWRLRLSLPTGGVPALAVLALAPLAAVAAGCGSSSSTTTPTASTASTSTPSASTPSTSPPSTSTTVPAPTTATTGVATTTVPARCATADLSASLTNPDGTAGGADFTLALRNNGTAACVLQGYPGVSVVAAHGVQVGAAAARLRGSEPTVIVAPGTSADAVVSVADAGNFPASCRPTPVLGFRIYPPDQTTSLYVARLGTTCAATGDKTLGVGALHPA